MLCNLDLPYSDLTLLFLAVFKSPSAEIILTVTVQLETLNIEAMLFQENPGKILGKS